MFFFFFASSRQPPPQKLTYHNNMNSIYSIHTLSLRKHCLQSSPQTKRKVYSMGRTRAGAKVKLRWENIGIVICRSHTVVGAVTFGRLPSLLAHYIYVLKSSFKDTFTGISELIGCDVAVGCRDAPPFFLRRRTKRMCRRWRSTSASTPPSIITEGPESGRITNSLRK